MTTEVPNKTGVLLVNLGSPRSTKTRDVRAFLREFLGDPRVVDLPRPLWWLILNFFILPFRPRKSAHAYRAIWSEQGSPLIVFTQRLTEQLARRFANQDLIITSAMRYGSPSLREQLQEFNRQGIQQIVILPLYPQYSSTTTASVFDAAVAEIGCWRYVPALRFISDYHRHPAYIKALAASVLDYWQRHGQAGFLLMSFHGLPEKLTQLGDPYFQQCQTTARLLAAELNLSDTQWRLVFQSRFGRAEWLKPYCVEVLRELPNQNIHKIDVVCPGFAADCLETLEEIAIANKQIFIEAGGRQYRYIPALNDADTHVDAMAEILKSAS